MVRPTCLPGAAVGTLLIGVTLLACGGPTPSGTGSTPVVPSGVPQSSNVPTPSALVLSDHADYEGRLLVQHLGNAPDGSESDATDSNYGTRRLFLMNPDGTGVEELAPGQPPEGKLHADVAPDASRVAFMDNSDEPKIHEVGLDGSGLRTITDCACVEGQPAYSHDMTRLAFVHWDGDTGTIGVRDLRTNEVTLLAETSASWPEGADGDWPEHPSWSPDGSRIAYALLHYDERGTVTSSRILQIEVETREIKDLGVPPELFFGEPRYSPDGSLLLIASRSAETTLGRAFGDVYTVRPDGTQLTLLTSAMRTAEGNRMIDEGTGASWTPEGKILFFGRNHHWLMNADGGDLAQWDADQPDLADNTVGYSYTAYWVPAR